MVDEMQAAQDAARAAGSILMERFSREHEITFKGPIDIVTEADLAAEQRIVEMLGAVVPGYGFLTEEHEEVVRRDGRWIVDPLDGTLNFCQGDPHFCVSIALERQGELVMGVIYDPVHDELFAAQRGAGARLNGRPIHVSRCDAVANAIMSTGFPYDAWTSERDNASQVTYWNKRIRGLRSTGSSALDLTAIACGRRDAHWEYGLFIYDHAAGTVLVREAGGVVTDYRGGLDVAKGREIVAANPVLHALMLPYFKGQL